jgi:hypothetical protein
VPPVVAVCELPVEELPWFIEADEPLEQVSASLSMLAIVITVAESELAVVLPLLLCELAVLLCAGAPETTIVTC